jgi:hypothetical protein
VSDLHLTADYIELERAAKPAAALWPTAAAMAAKGKAAKEKDAKEKGSSKDREKEPHR